MTQLKLTPGVLATCADGYAQCADWRANKANTDKARAWAAKAKKYATYAHEAADDGRVADALHCTLMAADAAGLAGGCMADHEEQQGEWLKAVVGTDTLLTALANK